MLCSSIEKKTSPECDDIAGTTDMHEINIHLDQQSEYASYPATTINLPYSCSNCRSCNENEFPCLSILNMKQ